MSALSDYLEENILNLICNGDALSAPATYIALFTSDPTDAGSGTEVSGGGYARVLVNANGGASPTWNLATEDSPGHKVSNAAAVAFPQATEDWGEVTHVAVFDAASGGNLLMHGPLTTPKTVGVGDTFQFAAGALSLRLE